MAISVRHGFERRLGLFPIFFDDDSEMYAYTGFGDWPIEIPYRKIPNANDIKVGLYLLSFNKPVDVSSSLPDHPGNYGVNEDVHRW
jgi:hypothetical protein